MIDHSLRRIEASLRTIADDVANHDPDDLAHELIVIAVQIGAQAEMVEKGLAE